MRSTDGAHNEFVVDDAVHPFTVLWAGDEHQQTVVGESGHGRSPARVTAAAVASPTLPAAPPRTRVRLIASNAWWGIRRAHFG